MRGNFSTLSKFSMSAAAAILALSLSPIAAFAGGDIGFKDGPAPGGRTIWEGFHVGGHIGSSDYDHGISQTSPASPLTTIRNGDDDFTGGFLYGSSWQFGQWVLGTDSAYSFGDAASGLNVAANGTSANADIDWSSSTSVRAGYLVKPNLMIFGTLGVAFAKVDVSGTLIAGGSDDETAVGYVVGGGVETTLGNRWFARVEYLHTDYGDENFTEVGGGRFNVDLDTDVVRGAIGYRFDWSPLDLLR
ncbi:MAG: outer membrane protein [Alphaproteobacteria bacterium]